MNAMRREFERLTSPRALGLVRILIGAAAALKALELGGVLVRLNDPATLHVPYADWLPAITDLPAALVIALWLIAAGLFAIGAFTTVAGAALTLLLAALLAADQQLYSNHLYLLALLVGLLTVGRAGAALSIDARRGNEPAVVPAWPATLIKIQVSIVYAFAGLAKLNLAYLSGSVVAVTLRRDGLLAVPDGWRTMEPMMALSVVAILAELGLAVALWLPRWRRAAFVVGLGLHVGIALWFVPTEQLLIFGMMMLPPYVLFLNVEPRSRTVIWDDSCDFCTSTVTWFRRLDWLHALTFAPGSDEAVLERYGVSRREADEAVQLVGPSGREAGYAAMAGVLEVLPIAFLVAPLMRVPPIARIGDRVYRRVALRRQCRIPTADERARSKAA